MAIEKVEISSKGQVVGSLEYEYPETLEDAIDMDGEEKVYKLFAAQRKIRAIDAKRRELTGGGLPKNILAALKGADPVKLAEILEKLGIEAQQLTNHGGVVSATGKSLGGAGLQTDEQWVVGGAWVGNPSPP